MENLMLLPRIGLLLALLAAACGGGGGKSSGPGGVPLDPSRPGDPVFLAGLRHYDAANALAAAFAASTYPSLTARYLAAASCTCP
jgi:hypothetical protein